MKLQTHKIIKQWLLICLLGMLAGWHVTGYAATISRPDPSLVSRAEIFLLKQQWSQAISLFAAHLKRNPQDLKARSRLIELYLLMNNRYEAEMVLAQAQYLPHQGLAVPLLESRIALGPLVAHDPTQPQGPALNRLQHLIQTAGTPHENAPEILYLKALLAKQADRLDDAEALFLRTLVQNPNFLWAQQRLIELYLETGELKLALSHLSQALDQNPNDVDTLFLMGWAYLEKGDPAQAIAALQASQKHDPRERPKRLILLAEAERKMGQTEQAVTHYQKVLAYWPTRDDIRQKLAQLTATATATVPSAFAPITLSSESTPIPEPIATTTSDTPETTSPQQSAMPTQKPLPLLLAEAEKAFWTDPLEISLDRYTHIQTLAPDRTDILGLLVDLHYRLWQDGQMPKLDAWLTLENALRQMHQAQQNALRVTDIQLQVMKSQGWTPGLYEALRQAIQEEMPAELKLIGELMLYHPAHAKLAAQSVDPTTLTPIACQRLVLHGAWPWVSVWTEPQSELTYLHPWVLAWASKHTLKGEAYLLAAEDLVRQQQWEQALLMLEKAQLEHPMSGDIALLRAHVYWAQQQKEAAQEALAIAKQLGISANRASQFVALEKTLAQTQNEPLSSP